VILLTFEYIGVPTPGLWDFENVFEHELDEALGITSALTRVANNAPPSPSFDSEDYFRYSAGALHNDAQSADDTAAIIKNPISATYPVTGSSTINVKTANIKALNIAGSFPPFGGMDGFIGLNTHITDIGSPGTTGVFSLLSTVEHEIDEVLGLGSDLGQADPFFNAPAPEDLFRYDSAGNRSYTTNPGALAFFSISGLPSLAQFDNQNDGGDWGDWQSNPLPPGVAPKVQDAFATPFAHPTLSVELRALDVIGYDPAAAVPEPGTLALLGSSLIGFAALRRRRQ
jgi:hypothetical protein